MADLHLFNIVSRRAARAVHGSPPVLPPRQGLMAGSANARRYRHCNMSEQTEASGAQPLRRVVAVTQGRQLTLEMTQALDELEAVAKRQAVQLLLGDEEAEKHGRTAASADELAAAEAVIVLGGDGNMIRALKAYGARIPVLGVNFGRVGFLTSASREQVAVAAERVFAGDYRVQALPTLDLSYRGQHYAAVNDVVVTSGIIGRLIRLGFSIDGEDQGIQPCDGLISATPSGSTAYNLSNGGPVLVWGLDAMVTSFIAPHSLNTRPLVTGAGSCLSVVNRSSDVPAALIVDGQRVGDVEADEAVSIRIASEQIHLGVLPEETFFRRYHAVFGARQ